MKLIPIKTPLIEVNDDLIEILASSIKKRRIKPKNGDILVVSSKVVALTQGRIVRYEDIKPSRRARRLAKKYSLDPRFVEVVLREADEVYGGVYRAILTMKNRIFVANAGVDISNAPKGYAILWPKNPKDAAEKIKRELEKRFGVKMGVIISDSYCIPLRAGTIAIALATAGFQAVIDERGKKDLFGKELRITRRAIADDLASAAHVVMGETDGRVPAVLIRGSRVRLDDSASNSETFVQPDKCLFSSIYVKRIKKLRP